MRFVWSSELEKSSGGLSTTCVKGDDLEPLNANLGLEFIHHFSCKNGKEIMCYRTKHSNVSFEIVFIYKKNTKLNINHLQLNIQHLFEILLKNCNQY